MLCCVRLSSIFFSFSSPSSSSSSSKLCREISGSVSLVCSDCLGFVDYFHMTRESNCVLYTHTHAYTNRHRKCATEQPLWYESRGFLGSGMSQYTLGTELCTCLKKTTLNTVQYTQQFGEYQQFELIMNDNAHCPI